MIIALHSAIVGSLSRSRPEPPRSRTRRSARGRRRRPLRPRRTGGRCRPRSPSPSAPSPRAGRDRPLDAGHEVAEDLLGDQEAALHLGDGLGRRLEQDDVVRAFAVPVDLVGEAAAAPGATLTIWPPPAEICRVVRSMTAWARVVRDVGSQDQHEFVSAHAPGLSFQWDVPRLTAMAGAEPKGTGRSVARAPLRLSSPDRGYLNAHTAAPRGGSLPASTILLIDADAPSAEAISTALTAVGYTVTTVADPGEAFGKVADHQLAIIDVVSGEKTAFDVCKRDPLDARARPVPILCVGQSDDVEDRIRFLEAGADDVMAKPFDNRELEARVEALLLRFQRSKDLTRRRLDGRNRRHPPAPDGRGPQPARRRRDDDGRDERGDGQGPREARPGRPRRPPPPVRPGRDAPQRRGEAVARRRRPRRRRDDASRSCSGPTRRGTTPVSTSSPRRRRRSWPS